MFIKRIISIIIVTIISFTLCGASVSALKVPETNTNVHLYMDYEAITNRESNQYKLEKFCYTDPNGIRCYLDENGNIYYLVALAPYYGTDIGTTYDVTLDNGSSFKVMLGDCKDPRDTTNDYGRSCWNFITKKTCTNVLEFIVDEDYLPNKVLNWGTLTAIDYFNGNIETIEETGRVWSPEQNYTYCC